MDAMEGTGVTQEVVCKETGPTENTKPPEAKNGYELLLEMVADVPQTRAKVCVMCRSETKYSRAYLHGLC